MEGMKLTVEDMFYDLEFLDSAYQLALVKGLMDLNYLSDSPLRLNLGNSKHKRELKNAFLKPLKASQIRELMSFIVKETKDNFQYDAFKRIHSRYLRWAKQIESYDKAQKKKLDTRYKRSESIKNGSQNK